VVAGNILSDKTQPLPYGRSYYVLSQLNAATAIKRTKAQLGVVEAQQAAVKQEDKRKDFDPQRYRAAVSKLSEEQMKLRELHAREQRLLKEYHFTDTEMGAWLAEQVVNSLILRTR
jgi:hypothetical protein